jgi:CRP-like cAMP-binding protein
LSPEAANVPRIGTLRDFSPNSILEALGPPVFRRLDVRKQHVRARDVLFNAYQNSGDVFFPHGGTVISLVRETEEGPQVEVGIVGTEGFAPANALSSSVLNGTTAIVQIDGGISRVSARSLRAEFGNDVATRALLLDYIALFIEHLTQSAVCNRVHSIEQRLSKWLLIFRDRVGSDGFDLSHEFMSKMLGIQRSGVTLAVGVLTTAGLIRHSRKHIDIRDSEGLRNRACECYGLMIDRLNAYRADLRSGRQM